MATLEELQDQVRAEIEEEKPLNKSVDGVISELTDDEYEQIVTDRANELYDQQQNGWIEDRIEGYGSIGSQLDMMYHDQVDGTTTWKDHVAKVKEDNPKPE